MNTGRSINATTGTSTGKTLLLGLVASLFCGAAFSQTKPKVLDFWGVGGFAHGSRFAANIILDSLAKAMDFELVKADQASVMTTANLEQYDVLILNNVTEPGKVFNIDQRAALLAFMKKRGFVAWHGSGDVKGTWPDYTGYLGAELSSHGVGEATINVDTGSFAKGHPLLIGMPLSTSISEEWYAYKTNPRVAPGVKVLFTLDEATCKDCTKMGGDHPIMWIKENPEGGRTYYQAMGHFDTIWKKYNFPKTMIAHAISWTSKCAIKSAVCTIGLNEKASLIPPTGFSITGTGHGITLLVTESGAHHIEIYDLGGKSAARKSGRGAGSISFSGLPPSEYTIVMRTKAGYQARIATVH